MLKNESFSWFFSVTGLVIILTIPALYERYEDYIDKYVIMGYRKLRQFCVLIDQKCLIRFQNLDLEKKKLSWSSLSLSISTIFETIFFLGVIFVDFVLNILFFLQDHGSAKGAIGRGSGEEWLFHLLIFFLSGKKGKFLFSFKLCHARGF